MAVCRIAEERRGYDRVKRSKAALRCECRVGVVGRRNCFFVKSAGTLGTLG